MAAMKALRSPSTSGSDTDHGVRRAAVLLPLILFVIGRPIAAEESKTAVWKVTEASFSYRSSIAVYSCGALQDRVRSILRAIGARDDLEVKVTGCDRSFVPVEEPQNFSRIPSSHLLKQRTDGGQLANVRVRLMMPTVVTPEVLAELDRDKSRRELVSRVTGDSAARLNDPIVFLAQRQPVTLSHGSIGLEPEECELLEQMSTSVFRQLGVRVVQRSSFCDRNRVSRIPPKLTVEVLMGIPFGTSTAPQIPAAGESDPDPSAPAASDAEPSEPATATPQK
jgi:hypothetical protein